MKKLKLALVKACKKEKITGFGDTVKVDGKEYYISFSMTHHEKRCPECNGTGKLQENDSI